MRLCITARLGRPGATALPGFPLRKSTYYYRMSLSETTADDPDLGRLRGKTRGKTLGKTP